MMQIDVIHKVFSDKDNPRTVATFTIPKELLNNIDHCLEYAYQNTQNVFGSWSKENVEGQDDNWYWDDSVEVKVPLHVDDEGKEWGLRSTSVGDEMVVKIKVVTDTVSECKVAQKYEVTDIGFKKVKA